MTKQLRYLKSTSGYTLIELIAVIAIIGILSGISYVGLSGATGREATRAASLELKGTIRNAQEQALTSKLNSASQPADHYGVILTSNQVQIIRVERCGTIASPTVVSSTSNPNGVTITTNPAGIKAITFQKNKGTVHFYDSSNNEITAYDSATLTMTGGGATYSVVVFRDTGRIE